MRSRRPSSEHQEAVSRRLAQLSAELAMTRPPESVPELVEGPVDQGSGEWWEQHTRVPARRLPDRLPSKSMQLPDRPPELVAEAQEAPIVPLPGRHVARRTGRSLAEVLPPTLRGRWALGPGQLAVVAVLVALGLAVTCWWIVRGDAAETIAPIATAPSPVDDLVAISTAPSSGSGAAAGAPSGTVTVDVAGKVRRPGIAVLDAGSRVVDALQAAGGPRPGVDVSGLNLARVLIDGEQVLVGSPAPVGTAASAVPAPGALGGPLVNLNLASQSELEELPEVGPVTALAIIAWRDEHGGFSSVDELLEVAGIGDATLGQLAPYVTV